MRVACSCMPLPLSLKASIKKMESAKVRGMAQLKRQGLREQSFVAKHKAISEVRLERIHRIKQQ